MFGPYYNQQTNIDRINNQIAELERMKQQIPNQPISQPTNLTQNFQIAPNNQSSMKYANSINEVQKEIIFGDTPFFSNDMSVVWIKNAKNEIRTYELSEIKPLDEKDIQIKYLQEQLNKMKKEKEKYEQYIFSNDETDTTEDDDDARTTIKESKSSSVSNVSKRKAK